MRLVGACALVTVFGVAGCSFDFAPFASSSSGSGGANDAGGAGPGSSTSVGTGSTTSGSTTTTAATTSAASGSTTASSATSSSTSSSSASSSSASSSSASSSSASSSSASSSSASSSSASSSSASTGAGGGSSTPLGACGGVTDDFATFPSATWQTHGIMSNPSGQAQAQVSNMPFDTVAGAWFHAQTFNDCAETVDLETQSDTGGVYLNIRQSGFSFVEIDYFDTNKTVVTDGNVTVNVGAKPRSLGIALTGGNVYYVYYLQGAWHIAHQVARPTWMDNNFGASLGFGLASATAGKLASFDNYDLPPVSPQDLGL